MNYQNYWRTQPTEVPQVCHLSSLAGTKYQFWHRGITYPVGLQFGYNRVQTKHTVPNSAHQEEERNYCYYGLQTSVGSSLMLENNLTKLPCTPHTARGTQLKEYQQQKHSILQVCDG